MRVFGEVGVTVPLPAPAADSGGEPNSRWLDRPRSTSSAVCDGPSGRKLASSDVPALSGGDPNGLDVHADPLREWVCCCVSGSTSPVL